MTATTMHLVNGLAVLRENQSREMAVIAESSASLDTIPLTIIGPFRGFEYARSDHYYYRRQLGVTDAKWSVFCGVECTLTEQIAASYRAESVAPISVRQADGDDANAIFDLCGLPQETSVAELARLIETDPVRAAMCIVTLEGRLRMLEQRLSARVGP